MDAKLVDELKKTISGEVETDEETLKLYSHDASLFEVMPQVIVSPKNSHDVEKLVQFVNKHKKCDASCSNFCRFSILLQTPLPVEAF